MASEVKTLCPLKPSRKSQRASRKASQKPHVSSDPEETEEEYEVYDCYICMDDTPVSQGSYTCSAHFCCNECLVTLFERSLHNTDEFPARCCANGLLSYVLSLDILGDDLRGRYMRKLGEYYTPRQVRVYCSNAECASFIPLSKFDNSDARWTIAPCECGAATCVGCKQAWDVSHRCEWDDDLRTKPEWVPEYTKACRIKKCPGQGCRMLIEHKEACNHMTCTACRHEFCFICMLPWEGFHVGTGCPDSNDPEAGYDEDGYERTERGLHVLDGRDRDGFDRLGLNIHGQTRQQAGIVEAGSYAEQDPAVHDQDINVQDAYNQDDYNADVEEDDPRVYNDGGFDGDEYDRYGFDDRGFDWEPHDEDVFDADSYDQDGFDEDGYDARGYDRNGLDEDGYPEFDDEGFNRYGYDQTGYDRQGLDQYGYDQDGWNQDDYDREGFDRNGYDRDGFDRTGHNAAGLHRDEVHQEEVAAEEEQSPVEHQRVLVASRPVRPYVPYISPYPTFEQLFCGHRQSWTNVYGSASCPICWFRMPYFHYRCTTCQMRVCRYCSGDFNHRLEQYQSDDLTCMVTPILWAEAGIVPFRQCERDAKLMRYVEPDFEGVNLLLERAEGELWQAQPFLYSLGTEELFEQAELEAEQKQMAENPLIYVRVDGHRIGWVSLPTDSNLYGVLDTEDEE